MMGCSVANAYFVSHDSHCDLGLKDKWCRCSGFGCRANFSVISGNEKNLGFVVLGEVLVVFPQRHIRVLGFRQVY